MNPEQLFAEFNLAYDDVASRRQNIVDANKQRSDYLNVWRSRSGGDANDARRQADTIAQNLKSYDFPQLDMAKQRFNESVAAAIGDYVFNADAYHAEAIAEAQEVGVPVDFRGDVASNVRPRFED
jgi:hypothetical protein